MPVRASNNSVHHIRPSLRRGIRKLARVWANLEPVRIWNCWRKAEIMPLEWHSLFTPPTDALLAREYDELGSLIARVHPSPVMRMDALEYVYDVCGENEREALNSDEDGGPTGSRMLGQRQGIPSEHGAGNTVASPSIASLSPRREHSVDLNPLSPLRTGQDSQESRAFPVFSDSNPWDGVQCGQESPFFTDLVDLDPNS